MSKSTLSVAVSKGVKSEIESIADSKDLSKSEVTYDILKSALEDYHTDQKDWLIDSLTKDSTSIGFVWILAILLLDVSPLETVITGLLVLLLLVYSIWFHE
jgi:hypothetical protein